YCSVQRITRITLVDRDAVGAEAPSSIPEKQPKPQKPRGGTDQDM
ncbi:MAG: hypothetical protein H0W83_15840, partial [Planctomycetes bacterium]|nr:hypothetical protein [Planctomycetota bacterium]